MPTLDLLTRPSFSTRHLVAAGALTALLVGAAAPARAHEFWLWPDRFAAAAGETLNVRALVGTGFRGELKPYAAPRVKRLELRTNRVTDLRGIPLNGGDEYARFITPDAAGGLLTYESDFATITLPGVDFDRYLALEGLDDARATHAKAGLAVPGRERYARCCRTWIASGTAAASSDPARVTTPAGLTLELTPARDPSQGGDVAFTVRWHGRPLAGALVRAWRRPLAHGASPVAVAARDSVSAVWEARSNAQGIVHVPVMERGEYMLSCVHMEPSAVLAEADWQSFWANFSFACLRQARR